VTGPAEPASHGRVEEIGIMRRMARDLDKLDQTAQRRVVRYLSDRYDPLTEEPGGDAFRSYPNPVNT
jgi:hypothetical protein